MGSPAYAQPPMESLTPASQAMLLELPDGEWFMWRRTYDDWGYSPLAQINGNFGIPLSSSGTPLPGSSCRERVLTALAERMEGRRSAYSGPVNFFDREEIPAPISPRSYTGRRQADFLQARTRPQAPKG